MRERKQQDAVAEAKRRMLVAAEHYNRGLARARKELRAAQQALKAHPDYARTVAARRRGARGREAYSLAWWLNDWLRSAETDAELSSFGSDLIRDARGGAQRHMERAIADAIERPGQSGVRRVA